MQGHEMMSLSESSFWRYWEGGNRVAIFASAVGVTGVMLFYRKVAAYLGVLNLDTGTIFEYTLNLFAIEFGALVSLFALLACRPTEFLNRIRNTKAFRQLFQNTKITLIICAVCIGGNFILGIAKVEPSKELTLGSGVFVIWAALCVVASICYTRTIRLIFLAMSN
jgi:hypothetical protein